MKIRPVGAEYFHADGRTDMTKLIVAFRNFANAPNNAKETWYYPLNRGIWRGEGRSQIEPPSFLDSVLDGGEWSNSYPGQSLFLSTPGVRARGAPELV